jgi:hypothetical protein
MVSVGNCSNCGICWRKSVLCARGIVLWVLEEDCGVCWRKVTVCTVDGKLCWMLEVKDSIECWRRKIIVSIGERALWVLGKDCGKCWRKVIVCIGQRSWWVWRRNLVDCWVMWTPHLPHPPWYIWRSQTQGLKPRKFYKYFSIVTVLVFLQEQGKGKWFKMLLNLN